MARRVASVIGAAALLLTACASTPTSPVAHKPLPSITATFHGFIGIPTVTAVDFVNARVGFVGAAESPYLAKNHSVTDIPGLLLRTTDGGRTWQTVATTPSSILAIDFLSPTKGFVLTGAYFNQVQMTLLATSDGGKTLKVLSHPAGYVGMAELRFTSVEDGVISRQNNLEWTSDGGRTWHSSQNALPPPGEYGGPMPYATDFLSSSVAFAAQDGSILRTTDGGASWQTMYTLPGFVRDTFGSGPVTFVTAKLGYAAVDLIESTSVGETLNHGIGDVVLRTQDGGLHWQPMSGSGYVPDAAVPKTGPPGEFSAITGWGQSHVAVMTSQGLAVSSDGGTRWTLIPVNPASPGSATLAYVSGRGLFAGPINGDLVLFPPGGGRVQVWPAPTPDVAVDFFSASGAVGLQQQPESELLISRNGGRVWRQIPLPRNSRTPSDVAFSDFRHGWLFESDGGGLVTTSDGGKTWHALALRAVYPLAGWLFAHGVGLLLVQPKDAALPPQLLATADGGHHLTKRRLPRGFAAGGHVLFASPSVGIAVYGISVWQTGDGGRTWHLLMLPTHLLADAGSLTAYAVDPAGDVWLLGLALPDGVYTVEEMYVRWAGAGWQQIRLPSEVAFTVPVALDAIGPEHVVWLTPAGPFLSTDRGRVWSNLSWPTTLRRSK